MIAQKTHYDQNIFKYVKSNYEANTSSDGL